MINAGSVQRFSHRIPYSIIIPLLLIVFLGVINISSASQATRPDLYFNHLMRFGLALVMCAITALVHTRIIRRLSFLAFLVSLILLVLVLAMGHTAKGAERWLVIGAFRLQPSDPAKIALILAIARYCSLHWPYNGYNILTLIRPLNISRPIGFLGGMVVLLTRKQGQSAVFSDQLLTSHLGMGLMALLLIVGLLWLLLSLWKLFKTKLSLEVVLAPIDVPVLPFFLISIEPDLGTALIILGIAGIMFLFIGIKRSSLLLGAVVGIGVSIFAYFTLLMDYQRQRIISFLNPEADLHGEGYHAMQSIIAIGSGRVTGKGVYGGTQTQLSFLPENATDFVFSVWAEEWGFVASICLLGLYLFLLWSILKVGLKVADRFSQLICVGVAANLFLHVIINVGMVTGMMPVVGVPLPLLSYGGSSMNVTLISLGLVANVAIWRGEK